MKLTTGIVALALMGGAARGQSPNVIQNTKDKLQAVQQQKTADSNRALQGIAAPAAKPSPAAPAKAPAAPAPVTTPLPATGNPAPVQPAVKAVPAKAAPAEAHPTTAAAKPGTATPKLAAKAAPAASQTNPPAPQPGAAPGPKAPKPEEKKYSMTGKRDPFISPVVSRQGGSGCSTGKKCLDIDQIAVRGVVKSDNGMIAVVTNGLNKAYFLRENDPVFNGYVLKITVDSVVFKQNFQDRLGKPFTKDVVKRITTPAV
jgi:hypothetical protein